MHQRDIFSGVRQFIGKQLLLKGFLYKVNQKRAKKLTLPLICYLRKVSCSKSVRGVAQTNPDEASIS
jgi:hypothetical protein